MARIQSTWPYRNLAIALMGLGLAIPLCSYLGMPSGTFSTAPDAPGSIRFRLQAEFEAFISELQQSDESMQEALKRP